MENRTALAQIAELIALSAQAERLQPIRRDENFDGYVASGSRTEKRIYKAKANVKNKRSRARL